MHWPELVHLHCAGPAEVREVIVPAHRKENVVNHAHRGLRARLRHPGNTHVVVSVSVSIEKFASIRRAVRMFHILFGDYQLDYSLSASLETDM